MSTENNTISVKDLTIKYAEKEAIIFNKTSRVFSGRRTPR